MKEIGKVVKVFNDGKVEVEMKASGGCAKCGLCKIGLDNKVRLVARSSDGIFAGDNVEIEMPEREVVLLTFLIFIMPLIAFFAGYLIFNYIVALILTVLYFIGLWLFDKNAQIKGKYLPFVVRKV